MTDTITRGEILDTLVHEAKSQMACIDNALFCRKHHPTYGYTKAGMWEHHNILVGMLYSIGVALGERSANVHDQAVQVGARYGIDLPDVRAKIKIG